MTDRPMAAAAPGGRWCGSWPGRRGVGPGGAEGPGSGPSGRYSARKAGRPRWNKPFLCADRWPGAAPSPRRTARPVMSRWSPAPAEPARVRPARSVPPVRSPADGRLRRPRNAWCVPGLVGGARLLRRSAYPPFSVR
ncbi:hypothetical protein CRV15_05870 [Streptomyces clavuligerus]|uniref:Uncharacterized protein n=1 Tax=Streptomyces clavuligerus TaxID=1901 RepID=B5H3T7_STRCL|nr:hypothetical protein D1794_06450 [Streptomyces clavuligerus]EDY53233.1 hypothetical protein SSCG_06270 [Streptomyces clavuligerus]EFG09610.1 Hypothetical protein SCLAV_4539 [Streptomyces clavuligerus]QCS05179.1 hypothetical protein CRV15_05870 [Streptomyces clavuligerus]QPJ95449.1 hypothetical protein GE265_22055 [Streptomyces clavuligerus]